VVLVLDWASHRVTGRRPRDANGARSRRRLGNRVRR